MADKRWWGGDVWDGAWRYSISDSLRRSFSYAAKLAQALLRTSHTLPGSVGLGFGHHAQIDVRRQLSQCPNALLQAGPKTKKVQTPLESAKWVSLRLAEEHFTRGSEEHLCDLRGPSPPGHR